MNTLCISLSAQRMKLLNYHVILVRDKNLLIFSIQDFSFKFKITNTFNINNLATSSDYLLFADTNHYLHLYDSEFKKTNSFPIQSNINTLTISQSSKYFALATQDCIFQIYRTIDLFLLNYKAITSTLILIFKLDQIEDITIYQDELIIFCYENVICIFNIKDLVYSEYRNSLDEFYCQCQFISEDKFCVQNQIGLQIWQYTENNVSIINMINLDQILFLEVVNSKILICSQSTIYFYDINTFDEAQQKQLFEDKPLLLQKSQDDQFIIVLDEARQLYSIQLEKLNIEQKICQDYIQIAILDNNYVILGCLNGSITIWNLEQKTQQNTIKVFNQMIEGMFILNDSIIANNLKQVALLDYQKEEKNLDYLKFDQFIIKMSAGQNKTYAILFSDSQIIIYTYPKKLVYKLDNKQEIMGMIFTTQELLIIYSEKEIEFHQYKQEKLKLVQKYQHKDIKIINESDSQILMADFNNIYLWNQTSFLKIYQLEDNQIPQRIKYLKTILAIIVNRELTLFDVKNQIKLLQDNQHKDIIDCYYQEPHLYKITADEVQYMPIKIKKRKKQVRHKKKITKIILNYPYLYTASKDKKIIKWDIDYKVVLFIYQHKDPVFNMVQMQNHLLSATIFGLHLWNTELNQMFSEVDNAHEGKIISISTTSLKNHILSSSEDWTIKLWKLCNKIIEQQQVFKSNSTPLTQIQFYNNHIFGLNSDNQIIFWDTKSISNYGLMSPIIKMFDKNESLHFNKNFQAIEIDSFIDRDVILQTLNKEQTLMDERSFCLLILRNDIISGGEKGFLTTYDLEQNKLKLKKRHKIRDSDILHIQQYRFTSIIISNSQGAIILYDLKQYHIIKLIESPDYNNVISAQDNLIVICLHKSIFIQPLHFEVKFEVWQPQTYFIKDKNFISYPSMQMLYQSKTLQMECKLKNTFGIRQVYYPKFKFVGEKTQHTLAKQMILSSNYNYFVQLLKETILTKIKPNNNSIQMVCHHILNNKYLNEETKLALFEESFRYIESQNYQGNTLQEFLRLTYYEALLSFDSGQKILEKILESQKYSQHLTFQELSLLLSILKQLKINPYQHEFLKSKLKSINILNLQCNPYLSSIQCKTMLLKEVDQIFQKYRLFTPQEFQITRIFNLATKEDILPEALKYVNTNRLHKQIEFFGKVRQYIHDYDVTEYDNFVEDVILEIVTLLPNLKSLNLGWINLSYLFCLKFSDYFMKQKKAPNIKINDNYRITNVGKKSLEVLYTKNLSQSVRIADSQQLEKNKEKIKEILEQIKSQKENFRLLDIEEQIRQINIEMIDLLSITNEILKDDLKQTHIQEQKRYLESLSQEMKQKQILLDEGIAEFILYKLLYKQPTIYCIYCNEYTCAICHKNHRNQQQSCFLCNKCYEHHQDWDQAIKCKNRIFDKKEELNQLYQKLQYSKYDGICLEGQLKVIETKLQAKSKLSKLSFNINMSIFILHKQVKLLYKYYKRLQAKILQYLVKKNNHQEKVLLAHQILELEQEEVLVYRFQTSVFNLDYFLRSKMLFLIYFIIIIFQYSLCLFLPLYYREEASINIIGHIYFIVFLILMGIFELFLSLKVSQIVNNQQTFEKQMKPLILNKTIFQLLIQIYDTLVQKYDLFMDIVFISILFEKRDELMNLRMAAISLIGFYIFQQIFQVLWHIGKHIFGKNETLKNINFYSLLFTLNEQEVLGEILDKFATKNIGSYRNMYIPYKMITTGFTCLFKNIPFLIIQIIYLIQEKNDITFDFLLTSIMTILSLLSKIFSFIKAKGSQIDPLKAIRNCRRFNNQ